MRFWDSSALVPLLVGESTSEAVLAEYERDPGIVVWWASEVECVSALSRLERDGSLHLDRLRLAMRRLDGLAQAWLEVSPGPRLRQLAIRLLRVHPLRSADAFQLAAATVAAEEQPPTLTLVTLDERLAGAAEREGFPVRRPGA